VVSLLGPELFEKSLSNTEEVKAREAQVFAMTGHEHQGQLKHMTKDILLLDLPRPWIFNDLYMNVALQLFSYEVAKVKGTDIDRPRNLAKSVTVE
jgi:glutamine---fructose-6-phosphate transaminase (isomerizing)